ncbi:MAG: hypothetical protein ACRC6O_00520 [Flavobacterium sp.]
MSTVSVISLPINCNPFAIIKKTTDQIIIAILECLFFVAKRNNTIDTTARGIKACNEEVETKTAMFHISNPERKIITDQKYISLLNFAFSMLFFIKLPVTAKVSLRA